MLRLDTVQIKDVFTPQTKYCIGILKNLIPKIVQDRLGESSEWLKVQIDLLKNTPKTVDMFVKQL
jgi:hypothetical protein